MISDKLLKALTMKGVRATDRQSFKQDAFGFLLYWHNGGCFETLGDNR